jgi:Ca2+/H+ antiporter
MCTTQQTLLLYTLSLWVLSVPMAGTLYFGITVKEPLDIKSYSYCIICISIVFYVNTLFLTLLHFSQKNISRGTLVDTDERGDL